APEPSLRDRALADRAGELAPILAEFIMAIDGRQIAVHNGTLSNRGSGVFISQLHRVCCAGRGVRLGTHVSRSPSSVWWPAEADERVDCAAVSYEHCRFPVQEPSL